MNYLSEVKGKSGTVARVVAYSQAENSGTKLITFEYEAYRGILAELNTHAILCKNAESSRAVPIKNRVNGIFKGNYYQPIHWGTNIGGMVAGEETNNPVVVDDFETTRDSAWKWAAYDAAKYATAFEKAGYAKQIAGRMLEPFITVKGVITATEWDNFWHLRRAPDADPAIKELADCMWKAKREVEKKGKIEILKAGEWHTPYVGHWRDANKDLFYYRELADGELEFTKFIEGKPVQFIEIEEALKTSAVACGQVSFRKLDTSEETVERVWKRLMGGEAIHASVTQHQGTPMDIEHSNESDILCYLTETNGVTHLDKNFDLWSAQFKHWIMFRKTIPNEVCNHYVAVDGE